MELATLDMDRDAATEALKEWAAAKGAEDEAIAAGYRAIAAGKRLISLAPTIANGGEDELHRPRLAVAPTTAQTVYLDRWAGGTVRYCLSPNPDGDWNRNVCGGGVQVDDALPSLPDRNLSWENRLRAGVSYRGVLAGDGPHRPAPVPHPRVAQLARPVRGRVGARGSARPCRPGAHPPPPRRPVGRLGSVGPDRPGTCGPARAEQPPLTPPRVCSTMAGMTTTQTPAAPDRLGDHIIRVSSSEWFVRSRRSSPGSYWRVQTADATTPICGCPAGRHIYPQHANRSADACHHFRVAVDFEIKRDRMAHPRPTPPPAPASMFVD